MEYKGFERKEVNRIRLHVLPTDRFKTYAISVYIGRPLDEDTVTPTALIPFVLRRGTEELPETKLFRERLDDLYGAGFGFDVYKRGDSQIVAFRMDIIDDRYVTEETSLLQQGLEFLGSVITKPVKEENHFLEKYVESEKNTIQKKLEAMINDKIRYAAERCIEEMCKEEPYRLHPLGKMESIPVITAQSLYQQYIEWLSRSPIDIYVVGNTSLEEVSNLVNQYFPMESKQASSYENHFQKINVSSINKVVERLDVSQGKLNMGLRSNITYADGDYPEALMYNGVLGAYPHSKLFVNVREKASLAYYASSRLDGHKGILTIQSGIELDNYDKAVEIIQQQLASMKDGKISELELSQTKAMLRNQLKVIQDSAFEMIAFDFNSVLSGKERSVLELVNHMEQVDVSGIKKVSEKVQLDTIYFLRDQKGE